MGRLSSAKDKSLDIVRTAGNWMQATERTDGETHVSHRAIQKVNGRILAWILWWLIKDGKRSLLTWVPIVSQPDVAGDRKVASGPEVCRWEVCLRTLSAKIGGRLFNKMLSCKLLCRGRLKESKPCSLYQPEVGRKDLSYEDFVSLDLAV